MVVNVLKGLFEWLHLWKTNMEPFGTGGLWRCVSFAMWWHLFGLVVSFCLKHRNPGRVMKCYQQKRDLFIQQQGSTWWFLVRGAMLVRKQRTAVLPGTPLSLQTCRWIFVFEKTQFLSTINMSSQTQIFSTLVLRGIRDLGSDLDFWFLQKKHGHWRHGWFRWKILRLQQSVRIFSWTSTYRPTAPTRFLLVESTSLNSKPYLFTWTNIFFFE